MAAKFLLAIAAIIGTMAALVFIPTFSSNNNNRYPAIDQTPISLQYNRQRLTRTSTGLLAATSADILTIENNGSATYRKLVGASDQRTFLVGNDDMKQLKDLIIGSGFLNIPPTDYKQKEGLTHLVKYTLKVDVGESNNNNISKTFNWADSVSYDGSPTLPPPSITNIEFNLDGIISKYLH